LPVGVDQRDGGDRHVEDVPGQLDDAVKSLLGGRVEQFDGLKLDKPLRLVGGNRWCDHGGVTPGIVTPF
jgi:hypothetical protein